MLVEKAKYFSYGTPVGLPPGDTDSDGDADGTDESQIKAWEALSAYDVRGDMDLDGDVDATDVAMYTAITMGRGVLTRDKTANRKGYAGYENDGWMPRFWHVRNRVYDTALARWTNRDRARYVDGPNLYQYVASQPVRLLDPSGLYFAECLRYQPHLIDSAVTRTRWNHGTEQFSTITGTQYSSTVVDTEHLWYVEAGVRQTLGHWWIRWQLVASVELEKTTLISAYSASGVTRTSRTDVTQQAFFYSGIPGSKVSNPGYDFSCRSDGSIRATAVGQVGPKTFSTRWSGYLVDMRFRRWVSPPYQHFGNASWAESRIEARIEWSVKLYKEPSSTSASAGFSVTIPYTPVALGVDFDFNIPRDSGRSQTTGTVEEGPWVYGCGCCKWREADGSIHDHCDVSNEGSSPESSLRH